MFSIVMLTFNSECYIEASLESLNAQDYRNYEVIIVDNGSTDRTIDIIKEGFSDTKLIQNKRNLGACKGRNQGIEAAKEEWVLTLDSDVFLRKDFLSNLSQIIEKVPADIGIIQPKILRLDGQTIYSCGIYLSWLRRFFDIGKGKKDKGQFDKKEKVFGACSAAAVYRRAMLEDIKEKTGYFDERFFFLVEDVDISWRARRKKWHALFYPKAVCYHVSESSNHEEKLRQYLCFRNRYYSITKNEGVFRYMAKLFPLALYDLPRICYLALTNRYIYKGAR